MLSKVLDLSRFKFAINRTCSDYVDKMNVEIDLSDERDLPFYELSVTDLQKHGFVMSQCLQDKLTRCRCGFCPKALEVKQAPKVILVHLEGHRLIFEDLCT
jgi:hypothetical protein